MMARIEPDTNIVERPIRSIVIGKKNSLFCGDPDSDGEAQWARFRNLACRRLGARRLRRNDQRSSPRVSGLELENRATINGLYKAEVIWRRGPWRSFEQVEFATLEWVDWFNNRRLLEPIGNIPPAEAETRYYAQAAGHAMAA